MSPPQCGVPLAVVVAAAAIMGLTVAVGASASIRHHPAGAPARRALRGVSPATATYPTQWLLSSHPVASQSATAQYAQRREDAPIVFERDLWTVCLGLLAVPVAMVAAVRRSAAGTARGLQGAAFGAGAAAFLTAASPTLAVDLMPPPPSVAVQAASRIAYVAEEKLVDFFGLDTPPTSYGGYGGNANELPRYKYKRPESWKFQVINKVQKGTQGVDSKFINPANKREQCFAITLSRAGEDAVFSITNVDTTFRGFAGADYDLADSLEYADEIIEGKREVDGQMYFDYDIVAENRYLATVTVKRGKVYAFFINAPNSSFKQNGSLYRAMLNSFTTLEAEGTMIYNG